MLVEIRYVKRQLLPRVSDHFSMPSEDPRTDFVLAVNVSTPGGKAPVFTSVWSEACEDQVMLYIPR